MILFLFLLACEGSYQDVTYCKAVCTQAELPYGHTRRTWDGRVFCSCVWVTPPATDAK